MIRRVTSQAEFDAAVAARDEIEIADDLRLEISGSHRPFIRTIGKSLLRLIARGSSQPHVEARESSQPHVEAWGSSQPHVVAWGSSQPHVEAWGSSQPHVEARESSQPHVVAWESSQPHVVAWGICQLAIRGAVRVVAAATVAIMILGGAPKIEGGGFIQRVDISTPQKWCDHYGVKIDAGVAILFKVVDEAYKTSDRGFPYVPGTSPEAPDWDGGKQECGKGLHFSPSTHHTLEFVGGISPKNRRFVACPVALDGLAVHPDGEMPQKVKAKGLAGPCWEVDQYGRPVAGAVVWSPPVVQASKPKKATARKRAKVGAKRRARS